MTIHYVFGFQFSPLFYVVVFVVEYSLVVVEFNKPSLKVMTFTFLISNSESKFWLVVLVCLFVCLSVQVQS